MVTPYTKASAQRILVGIARQILSVNAEVRRRSGQIINIVQVTYITIIGGRKCSTFLSKKAFVEENANFRAEGSSTVSVVEAHHNQYVVQSGANFYTVRPGYPDARGKCECADAHFRGAKCKHQVAVESFLKIGVKKVDEVQVVKTGAEQHCVYLNNVLVGKFAFDDWALGNQYVVEINNVEHGWFPTRAAAEGAIVKHARGAVLQAA